MPEPTTNQIKKVPIDKIGTDPSLQIRVQINDDTVTEYRAIIREFGFMDPMLVFNTGGEKYLLSKGHHRLIAYLAEGIEKVPCEIRKGDLSEAKWAAFQDGHGCLPLTNADKRKAAQIAVEDPSIGLKPDIDIARRIGVSASLIGEVRRGISPEAKREKKEKKAKAKPGQSPTVGPEPEPVDLSLAEPVNPEPAPPAGGGGGGAALAPVVTRQRKADKGNNVEKVTKPMALRQIDHWIDVGLINEDDVLEKLASATGEYRFLPKQGVNIDVKIINHHGKSKVKFVGQIREVSFGEIALTCTDEQIQETFKS